MLSFAGYLVSSQITIKYILIMLYSYNHTQCAKIITLLFFTGPANFSLTDAIINGFHSSFSILSKKVVVSEYFICFIIYVILGHYLCYGFHRFTQGFIFFPGESTVAFKVVSTRANLWLWPQTLRKNGIF